MDGTYTIVFGDIANLGQLLNQDEISSQEILSRHKSIVYSVAEKYEGKVLDHFTDSSKIIFKVPRNAILYCLEAFRKFSLPPGSHTGWVSVMEKYVIVKMEYSGNQQK